MEFVKVAEGDEIEVYQAMHRIEGTPLPSGEAKQALVPVMPEAVTDSLVKGALKAFSGRQINALSVSATGGITVRVTPRTCGGCGEHLEDAHRFCPACGTPAEEG
jgi:hypothetical protein